MRRVIIVLLLVMTFFSCASYHTMNDLSIVDFSSINVTLNSSQVTPERSYAITVSAFDPKKGKDRYVNLSKNVQITEINKFARVSYQVGSATITVAGTSMPMLDTGLITLKIGNRLNGTSREVSYPIRWSTTGRIVLPLNYSGSGDETMFKVALLDTRALPYPQGELLYVKNVKTGLIYLHSRPVTIEARGGTGSAGYRGASSFSYYSWGGAMDGADGADGNPGYPGGNIVIEGSKEALASITGVVTGGAGGAGGAGGLGAPSNVKVITRIDYITYLSKVEKVLDPTDSEYKAAQKTDNLKDIEAQLSGKGSSQNDMVTVRFRAGREGRAGRRGMSGPNGTVTKVVTSVDREAFVTNIALSKYLKISDLK